MVIKTKKGMFQIQKDYRGAFNEEAFNEKYIEECLDKYMYIVGDISSNILRLKGFDNDPKSENYYGFISNYLQVSCAFGCPYYVLKRIKSIDEYNKLQNDKTVYEFEEVNITPIKKESFDKDSLVLKSTPKVKPHINIDMNKINAIPKGELTADLKEFVKQEKSNTSNNSRTQVQAKPQEDTQTYVSASPDFDPSKSSANRFNRNNSNNRNNNNNNNNNNNSKNKNHNNKNKNKKSNKQV